MGGGARDQGEPTRILIVDDHPMVRERLVEVVSQETDFVVCGEAESTTQALRVFRATHPRLVLVDLILKESHGVDLVKALRECDPSVLILVVSMHEGALHAERVLRAGARGYISKQDATRNVIAAIRAILRGEIYLHAEVISRLTARLNARKRSKPALSIDALADRELRVFELIGRGFATREVADQLQVDIRTVETYRARIKEKLRLRNGTELLQHAIRWIETGMTQV